VYFVCDTMRMTLKVHEAWDNIAVLELFFFVSLELYF